MPRERDKDAKKPLAHNEEAIQEFLNDGTFRINPIQMQMEDIRIVIVSQRKLHFDSATIKENSATGNIELDPPNEDTRMIRRLLFGSTRTQVEPEVIKIRCGVSKRLMVSRLFAIPYNKNLIPNEDADDSDAESVIQMWDAHVHGTAGGNHERRLKSSFNTNTPEYLRSVSQTDSNVSRIPKLTRGSSVSFGYSRRLTSTLKYDRYRYIGLAVLFNPKYLTFLSTHFNYFDREFNDLQMAMYEAFTTRGSFHINASACCRTFRTNLMTFHNAMRLSRFALTTPDERFIRDFVDLVDIFENREKGFLLSKLISAVLMYHSTWALTTRLSLDVPDHEILSSEPLLTALGCVGQLSHTTRIVVTGADARILTKLLNVLTFFVQVEGKQKMAIGGVDPSKFNHYSVDNLWPFSTTERRTMPNMKPEMEAGDSSFVKIRKRLNKDATHWLEGKLKPMMAHKQKLREKANNTEWKLKFIKVEKIFLPHPPRHMSRLRPDDKVVAFRPRSASDPVFQSNSSAVKFVANRNTDKYAEFDGSFLSNLLVKDERHLRHSASRTFRLPKFEGGEAHSAWSQKPLSNEFLGIKDWLSPRMIHIAGRGADHDLKKPDIPELLVEGVPQDGDGNPGDDQTNETLLHIGGYSFYSYWPWVSAKDKLTIAFPDNQPIQSNTLQVPINPNLPSTSQAVQQINHSYPPRQPRQRLNGVASSSTSTQQKVEEIFVIPPASPDTLQAREQRRKRDALLHHLPRPNYSMTIAEKKDAIAANESRLRTIEERMSSFVEILEREKNTSLHHQITSNFFGGICDSFCPGFIMHAIDSNKLSATQLEKCIKREVQHAESFYLTVPKEHPVNVESENACGSEKLDYFQLTSVVINADIDVAKTMIYYGDARTIQEEEMSYPCDIVQGMVERVKSMHSDPILTIQDIYNSIWGTMENIVRKAIQLDHFVQSQDTSIEAVFNSVLSNVYNKSNKRVLNEIRRYHKTANDHPDVTPKPEKVSAEELIKLLDCEYSDLRLLTNICSITSPSIRGAMDF